MRTEKVNFYSEGDKLSGVLYLPDSDQSKPFPGIVQGPGFLGLKDAKHYIMMFEKLCAADYACLCFDYRSWGDSEGNDRGWVIPKWQAEDMQRHYLHADPRRNRSEPDRNLRIGRHRGRQRGVRCRDRFARQMLRLLSRREQRARLVTLDAARV